MVFHGTESREWGDIGSNPNVDGLDFSVLLHEELC